MLFILTPGHNRTISGRFIPGKYFSRPKPKATKAKLMRDAARAAALSKATYEVEYKPAQPEAHLPAYVNVYYYPPGADIGKKQYLAYTSLHITKTIVGVRAKGGAVVHNIQTHLSDGAIGASDPFLRLKVGAKIGLDEVKRVYPNAPIYVVQPSEVLSRWGRKSQTSLGASYFAKFLICPCEARLF